MAARFMCCIIGIGLWCPLLPVVVDALLNPFSPGGYLDLTRCSGYHSNQKYICDPQSLLSRHHTTDSITDGFLKYFNAQRTIFTPKCTAGPTPYRLAILTLSTFPHDCRPSGHVEGMKISKLNSSKYITREAVNISRITEQYRENWTHSDYERNDTTVHCPIDLLVVCAKTYCWKPEDLLEGVNFGLLISVGTSNFFRNRCGSIKNMPYFGTEKNCGLEITKFLDDLTGRILNPPKWTPNKSTLVPEPIPIWAWICFVLCIIVSFTCFSIGNCISKRQDFFKKCDKSQLQSKPNHGAWRIGFGGGLLGESHQNRNQQHTASMSQPNRPPRRSGGLLGVARAGSKATTQPRNTRYV